VRHVPDAALREAAMHLLNLRLGSNDLDRAGAFYDATFAALGLQRHDPGRPSPTIVYKLPNGPNFAIGLSQNDRPASASNGFTAVFDADSEEDVAAWHAAGVANGGTCAGAPGPKVDAYNAYGAYLHDPDGNKLSAYHGLVIR
jgi:catechol 2,3-dioxygenase-like lactoylglutathione lyase family enzyme